MELIVLAIFAANLLFCLISGRSIIIALIFGFFLFFLYSLIKKHSIKETCKMAAAEMHPVVNLLLIFILIGMITGSWRASGTIATIIYHASQLITPAAFLLAAFLLNCLVALLTGTAFGTVATMGVVCASIGSLMGVPPAQYGGAILAGIFFGDRCSPMSSSAHLVCEITKTNIFRNVQNMLRTAIVPFVVSCALYFVMGQQGEYTKASLDLLEKFSEEFSLNWITLLPAVLIIALSLFKVNVKLTMLASIITASLIAIFAQNIAPLTMLRVLVFGYQTKLPELSAMLDGGGILSMAQTGVIITISASFSGIFDGTGMLDNIKRSIQTLALHTTPFFATLISAIVTAAIFCNQVMASIMTQHLCKEIIPDPEEMAITLEDTAIVIAAMLPWCIAAAVPLATVSAPASSVLFAFYLYLQPIWRLLRPWKPTPQKNSN